MTFCAKGLYTAMITPFTSYGELDEEGLRQNIKLQVASGVDGLVVLGTTGEVPTLSDEERVRIISITVKEVKGKIPVIVGTGCYSTRETIANGRQAVSLGADALLVVTPYYNRPSQEGLYEHFKAVAENNELPIILYNVPGRTGVNLHVETVKRLASVPRIVGIKECSGQMSQVNAMMESVVRQHSHFTLLSGDDILTFPLMTLGAHGIISVVSNLIPQKMKQLVSLIEEGNYAAARELHYQLTPLFVGAAIETNPTPIKAAMQLRGMAAGGCRLPLASLLPENQQQLETVLQKIGGMDGTAQSED